MHDKLFLTSFGLNSVTVYLGMNLFLCFSCLEYIELSRVYTQVFPFWENVRPLFLQIYFLPFL